MNSARAEIDEPSRRRESARIAQGSNALIQNARDGEREDAGANNRNQRRQHSLRRADLFDLDGAGFRVEHAGDQDLLRREFLEAVAFQGEGVLSVI